MTHAGGRPSIYSDEIAMAITSRMAEGESLRSICRDPGMPGRVTVLYWLADGKHAEFLSQYSRACEARADLIFDEILEISDESEVAANYQGDQVTLDLSPTAVARNRLRIDARKWAASKMVPKKYGDKTTVAGDADNPVKMDVNLAVSFVKPNV